MRPFCQTPNSTAVDRDPITDSHQLLSLLGLAGQSHRALTATSFPCKVPMQFVRRMATEDPQDPLLRQVLPTVDEEMPAPGFVRDPVGDLDAETSPGLLRKYRGRALLIATGACAIHCRYCFRRHFPYVDHQATASHLDNAIAAIAADDSVSEVILSGGDPLTLGNRRLTALFRRLESISHVRRLRLHSRVPVVQPSRVDEALCALIAGTPRPVIVVLHANHAAELDDAVAAALDRLIRAGATLLNQSVLLRGVNDCVDALAKLSEQLFACGVLPYYLHQLDPVAGAAHFLVPDETALSLYRALRERLPGYLVPRLVREIAGGRAKTPLPELSLATAFG